MLGEAATMGCAALALAGLLLLTFDRREQQHGPSLGRVIQCSHVGMACLGLGAGMLCRGVLFGVAVPCLAVGLNGVVTLRSRASRRRRWFAFATLGIGAVAMGFGVRAIWTAPNGYSRLLGATLAARAVNAPFDVSFTTLLHELFPVSAVLPVSAAVLMFPPRSATNAAAGERAIGSTLLFSLIGTVAASGLMALRGVNVAYSGTAAVAGVVGLSMARFERSRRSALGGLFVLTLAVVLLGDFVNLPDKTMLMTGVFGAHLPLGFETQNQYWIGAAVATLAVGASVATLGVTRSRATSSCAWERYRALFRSLQQAYSGQLVSAVVLVETALVTTALLERAHDRDWISAPFFDQAHALVGSLLTWAWLIPIAIVVVVPLTYTTIDIGVTRLANFIERRGSPDVVVAIPCWRADSAAGVIFSISLIVSGLVMTLGHGVAMAEQLSPKRAISQYRAHAKPNEPLAVLGVKPESLAFYVAQPPVAFYEIEAAARWLAESETERRWIAFGSDRLSELNGAYRSVTNRRNLSIIDPVVGNLVLATNRLALGDHDHNPLSADLLDTPPPLRQKSTIQFGDFCEMLGWEIRNDDGSVVVKLVVGRRYELRLVFQVIGTTNMDWQVFVHIDGRGRRHNGDHDPVSGRYPTTLWQPGDIIVDRHSFVLDRGSLLGEHILYMGLFRGNKRLEVTSGQADENRVRLGTAIVE
jgi:hypothetical protein